MASTGNPSHGTKVTTDPTGKHNIIREGAGAVIGDSLAAESFRAGGGFAENRDAQPLGVKAENTTLNTTDTSAATELPPAARGADRADRDVPLQPGRSGPNQELVGHNREDVSRDHAQSGSGAGSESQAASGSTSGSGTGSGTGKAQSQGNQQAGTSGQQQGGHHQEGVQQSQGGQQRGGQQQQGGQQPQGGQEQHGGKQQQGLPPASKQSAAAQGLLDLGKGGPRRDDNEHQPGVAPTYVDVDVVNPPIHAKPHGKNIKEGDIDPDAPNASMSGEIGTENDPGRKAEERFERYNTESARDLGPRDKKISNDDPYAPLKMDEPA